MEMPLLKDTPETKVKKLLAGSAAYDIEHAFCRFDTKLSLLYNE
jgi:hypothetical protein